MGGVRAMSQHQCAAEGCERPASTKGYCKMHAERIRRNGTTELQGRPRAPMAERLAAKVDRRGADECWPWLGALSPAGYGKIRTGPQGTPSVGAHRAAWLVANPCAAEPPVIDHACHDPRTCVSGPACPHRRCCNPSHLVPSTPAENGAPDRQWTRALRAECDAGHEYTPENTYVVSEPGRRPHRRCRTCDRIRAAERRRAS